MKESEYKCKFVLRVNDSGKLLAVTALLRVDFAYCRFEHKLFELLKISVNFYEIKFHKSIFKGCQVYMSFQMQKRT
jgi:hypothetical protein